MSDYYPEGVSEADIDALSEETPVTCRWCNVVVDEDSEYERFCSQDCHDSEHADSMGTDYDSGPNTSDRGILRDEFHV